MITLLICCSQWCLWLKVRTNQKVSTEPTLPLGIIFRSPPNLRKTSPQFWSGFIPTPSIVRIEVVFSSTRNWIGEKIPHRRRIGWLLRREPLRAPKLLWRAAPSRKLEWFWKWLYSPCSSLITNQYVLTLGFILQKINSQLWHAQHLSFFRGGWANIDPWTLFFMVF